MATTPVPPFANIDPSFVLHADGTFSAAGGGGSVTDVTATSPLASSGGATPDISITLPSDATKYLDGTGNFTTPAGSGTVTAVTATPPATSSGGTTPNIAVPAFVASGASHAAGLVPDPGVTGGTTKFLREDASFQVPPGTGVTAVTGTPPVTSTGGTTPAIGVPVFVASGASHASGLVPDPGVTGGTTKFLREDASFQVPAGTGVTSVTGTAPVTSTGGTTPAIGVPDFVASGGSHASGLVPDPGASSGTTKFLREDSTWQVPAGGTPGLVQLAQSVLGSDVPTVTFSSISGSYTNLILTGISRTDVNGAAVNVQAQFNGVNTGYTNQQLQGRSTTATASSQTVTSVCFLGVTTGTLNQADAAGWFTTKIFSYANTNFNKHFIVNGGAFDGATGASEMLTIQNSGRWANTAAITSIVLSLVTGNFKIHSVFTLYGEL